MRLISYDDASAALLAVCRPVAPERVPLAQARGCVSAETLVASAALPPLATARRAGWAVVAAETVGATPYVPAFGATAPRWVGIGDVVEPPADAVIAPAAVDASREPATVLATATTGEGLRRPGEDLAADMPIVQRGRMIGGLEAWLLRASGIEQVAIYRPKVLFHLRDDGDRTVEFLERLVEASGGTSTRLHVDDWRHGDAFEPIVEACDLFVDLTPGRRSLDGIAVRGGESIGCGDFVEKPVIYLPSRLECAALAWLLLLRPCLDTLTTATPRRPCATRPLTRKIASAPGLADLVLLREAERGAAWEPIAMGDIPWHALAKADAWLVVPAASEGYARGTAVFAEFLEFA